MHFGGAGHFFQHHGSAGQKNKNVLWYSGARVFGFFWHVFAIPGNFASSLWGYILFFLTHTTSGQKDLVSWNICYPFFGSQICENFIWSRRTNGRSWETRTGELGRIFILYPSAAFFLVSGRKWGLPPRRMFRGRPRKKCFQSPTWLRFGNFATFWTTCVGPELLLSLRSILATIRTFEERLQLSNFPTALSGNVFF